MINLVPQVPTNIYDAFVALSVAGSICGMLCVLIICVYKATKN